MGKRRNKRLARKKRALARGRKAIHVGGHVHAVRDTGTFSASFEKYVVARIRTAHIRWEWVGTGLALVVIFTSIASGYFKNNALFGTSHEIIQFAAHAGDYTLAQRMYENGLHGKVLGAETLLEELIYPEKSLENAITTFESKLLIYPHSRDIMVTLSRLYKALGDETRAHEYWERARVLDPNNEMFR